MTFRDPLAPERATWTAGRVLSVLLALLYVLALLVLPGGSPFGRAGLGVLLALACIWFAQPISDASRGLTRNFLPAPFVAGCGWLLLVTATVLALLAAAKWGGGPPDPRPEARCVGPGSPARDT